MVYRVQGTKLTANGKPIKFHGININGFELKIGHLMGMWTKKTFGDYLTAAKQCGFNGIRIPVTSSVLRGQPVPNSSSAGWYPPNDYIKGMDSRQLLKQFVKECEDHGFYYVIDWHYLEDGIRQDGSSIPPRWYTNRYSDSDWIRDLTDVATLFKGQKGFVGIDLKNEPDGIRSGVEGCTWGDGNPATDWKLASERAYQAIDRVNSDIIVIVEWLGQGSGLDYMVQNRVNIPRDRYCYSVHLYGPGEWDYAPYDQMYQDGSFPNNMPSFWDKQWGNVAKSELIFVGEYGSFYDTGRQKAWLDTLVKYMAQIQVDFAAYWLWSAESDRTGGILADTSYSAIRQDKVDALRPLKDTFNPGSSVVIDPVRPPKIEEPEIPGGEIVDDIDLGIPMPDHPLIGEEYQLRIGKTTIDTLIVDATSHHLVASYIAKDGIIREARFPLELFKE